MFAGPLNTYGKDNLSFSAALIATRANSRKDRVDIVESGIRIYDNKTFANFMFKTNCVQEACFLKRNIIVFIYNFPLNLL